MAGLLLFPPTVHAGSYAVTYTGGASPTITPADVGGDSSFNATYQYASATSAASPRSGSANSFTLTANPGPTLITATLTWVPADKQTLTTDPPPACILVEQNAVARWYVRSVSGTGTYSGTNDCGLPGAITTSYMISQGCPAEYSSADHWEVLSSPGASFTRSCSPSASFTGHTGANGLVSGEVDVQYGASAYPVTINITGQNSANQALTGQQITATLNGIPAGVKVTSYTWSFSGGTAPNPIKNWDGTASGDSTHPQRVPLTAADLTKTDTSGNGISVNPVSFYDQVADNVTVKCAVSLKFPDGTAATANATSVPVAFLKPSASWNAYTTGPFVNGSSYGANEIWKPVTITLPPAFTSIGGIGGFVQLITPSGQETRNPAPGTPLLYTNTYYEKVPDGQGGWVLPTEGLDTDFLYPFGYAVNPDGSIGAASTTNYHWDVSSTGASGDKPSLPYNIPAVDGDPGGTNWYTATNQNNFHTWLMYKPGSTGAIWVPLLKLDWSMNVTITKTNGTWAVDSSSGVTNSPITTADSPPSWTKKNVATQASLRP